MNKVQLIGNSGADGKLEYTKSSLAICKFSVATSEKAKEGSIEKFISTWHSVILFGKAAEAISPRIKRGSKLFIEGKISPREWTDKSGNKQRSVDIIASQVYIIEKEPKVESNYAEGQTERKSWHPPAVDPKLMNEEDIPF